jgi:hypothetical protein
MLACDPTGPPPGKLTLSGSGLPALKRMPPHILDQGIDLPKNSVV